MIYRTTRTKGSNTCADCGRAATCVSIGSPSTRKRLGLPETRIWVHTETGNYMSDEPTRHDVNEHLRAPVERSLISIKVVGWVLFWVLAAVTVVNVWSAGGFEPEPPEEGSCEALYPNPYPDQKDDIRDCEKEAQQLQDDLDEMKANDGVLTP